MNNIKIQKIHYYILMIFLCLSPVIDVFNSLLQRNGITLSVGILYKGLMLIYLGYFIIFKVKKNKYKNMFFIYLFLLLIWILLFVVNRYNLLTVRDIFNELVIIFKNFYIIILSVLLYFFFKSNNIDVGKIKKIFYLTFFIYLILLLVPFITNTGFESYKEGINGGVVGWFYAANEVGAILLLLFFYNYKELISKNFFYFIAILLFILLGLQIGTKVVLIGLISILVYYLLSYFILKKYKNVVYTIFVLIFTIFMSFNGVVKDNINNLIDQGSNTPTIDINEEIEISDDLNNEHTIFNNYYVQKALNVILSGRYNFLKQTNRIYMKSNLSYKILGMGYTNTKVINNKSIEKLIEIDIFDIFYHCGLIGFILFISPFIYLAIHIIKNFKYVIKNFDIFSDVFLIILILFISLSAGHVLSAPSVSLFLALYFIELLEKISEKEKKINGKN